MRPLERVEQAQTGWDDLRDEYYYRLPADVQWYSTRCSLEEVSGFFHRCGVYDALSGNTGRVVDSARMVTHAAHEDEQAIEQATRIRGIVEAFAVRKLRPLCLGTSDLSDGPFNVMEGNCRAVALEILRQRGATLPHEIPVYVGRSLTGRVRSWEGREPDAILTALLA